MDSISSITFGTSHVWKASEANDSETGCASAYKDKAGEERSADDESIIVCMKERDGSDYVFDLPGGLDERIQIAVTDGDQTKRIYMGVVASTLTLSRTKSRPTRASSSPAAGSPKTPGSCVSDITIDDEPLVVDDAGTAELHEGSGEHVAVTSSGEFTATVRVWTDSDSTNNPTLDDDTYTIKVVDQGGFEGEVDITIAEPTVSVTPDTASPRDFIVISGMNWPISTPSWTTR